MKDLENNNNNTYITQELQSLDICIGCPKFDGITWMSLLLAQLRKSDCTLFAQFFERNSTVKARTG